jgi:3D (Asp-Asp-Asp) domain-containing protein
MVRGGRRAAGSRLIKAPLLSLLLALTAGATVSQARQQEEKREPAASQNEAASAMSATANPTTWSGGASPVLELFPATVDSSPATTVSSNPHGISVRLNADGVSRIVYTDPGTTVGALLRQEDVALGDQDRCSASLSTRVKGGATIWVARIRKALTVDRAVLPYSTRRRYTADLGVGDVHVLTPGKAGEHVVTYHDIFRNGRRTERAVVSDRLTPPRTQVELMGVRGMTLASRGYFSGKRLVEMIATGYGPGENGRWGARTASGLRPGRGVVAVDPRFIPLGTRLYVEGYGYCVAGDTGGAIRGNRIDLGMDSYGEASDVGRRRVHVLILD